MRISGMNVRVYNIHADSVSDNLPPSYQVFTEDEVSVYIGYCHREARAAWRWGLADNRRSGVATTRAQCLAAIIAQYRLEQPV